MNDALIKIAAVVALLVILFFGEQYIEKRGYDRARAEDAAVINQLKSDAATTLAAETDKVRKAEKALQDITDTQNLKDSDHEKTVSYLSDRLRHAAGPAGRLRDPNQTAGCRGGGGCAQDEITSASGDHPNDGSEAGGLLSKNLTGLFQQLTREADDINDAYISCRADAFQSREALK